MTDYDATAHIAEEIKDPQIKAPWSIALALGFTWIGGWLFTIVLAYCSGDPTHTLSNVVDQPVAQIFYDVIGRNGGIFFTVAACFVLNFTAMTAIQAGARTIWAYARDEMLPLSRVWYIINKRTDTPVYAVWLFSISCILINLIALGSYTAIAAIFNLTAIALDWSYCIPIICKMAYGKFERGPFHLGWASLPINAWAVVWTTFVTIIYVMPTIRPVTPENVRLNFYLFPFSLSLSLSPFYFPSPLPELQARTHHLFVCIQMNYVVVLMAAVAIFAIGYWYAAGRHYYVGPRVKAQLIMGVSTEEVNSSGGSSDEKREGGVP